MDEQPLRLIERIRRSVYRYEAGDSDLSTVISNIESQFWRFEADSWPPADLVNAWAILEEVYAVRLAEAEEKNELININDPDIDDRGRELISNALVRIISILDDLELKLI